MALSAAQATFKRTPIGLMLSLWLGGLVVRILCLSAWPNALQMPSLGAADSTNFADDIARLHTDNHFSIYTLVALAAQALGAKGSVLRATSLGCDGIEALLWLVWLRGRSSKAASIMMALWAASPLLVHTATSAGPHAAFGMWATLGFMALWPVWQQQRPSTGAQLWLLLSWALLVCVHPLGVLAVAAMVLTAIAWPKATAQSLSNTLNTTVGQAGRLALNIGQPALVAGIVYLGMRLLGHIYPSPELSGGATELSFASVARTLSAAWGTDATAAAGPFRISWPMPEASAVVLTLVFASAGISHPIGQRLVCIAALYGASLAAYHGIVPVFTGPTLVPAWLLLMAGAALGLSQARAAAAVHIGVACILSWQLNVWLNAQSLFCLPF